jgi:putative transposase
MFVGAAAGQDRCMSRSLELRRGRRSEIGRAYLLTFVTHARTGYFADAALAQVASRALASASTWPDATLFCWVLMPDHWHGLVELRDGALSRSTARAKSVVTREVRQSLGRHVAVWQDGYHDRAIRDEEDMRAIARYVVANPLRAGLAGTVGDYPYCDAVWL